MQQPERFSLHPHARFRVIDDEGVFVLQESGEVLVVNRVAAHLVTGIREGASLSELVGALVGQFDVGEDRAREDVQAIVDQLVSAGALVPAPPSGEGAS